MGAREEKRSAARVLIACAVAGLPLGLHAVEPAVGESAWSLEDVYRLAVAEDARLAAARAALEAGREQRSQGRALLLPALGIGANTTYNDLDVDFTPTSPLLAGGVRRYNSHGYNLTLTQPVYRAPELAAFRQANALAAQADTRFAIAQQELILRVARAYFDVLLARDRLAFAVAFKSAVAAQLKQTKRAFDLGAATVTEVREAQARYDLADAQEFGARNELVVQREAVRRIVGRVPGELAPLAPEAVLPPPAGTIEEWAAAAEGALAVRLAEQALTAARQEVARQRGEQYPAVDALATYVAEDADNSLFGVGIDSEAKAIGLRVQMPLYAGGALRSRVREAVANEERARRELEDARRGAELAVRTAFLGLATSLSQVRAFQQAVVSSESALDAITLGRKAGTRTLVNVLDAEQQLYAAKRDLAQARYGAIVSELELRGAAGRLAEKDVTAVDRLLLPKRQDSGQ